MSTNFTNLTGDPLYEFPVQPKRSMAEDEYVAWVLAENVKAEWVDGEVVFMSPANAEHTELRCWLLTLLRMYCEDRLVGRAMDDMLVRLSRSRRFRIPDIFFVARERIGIIGRTILREPPDMVVEIVSPDSSSRDWREKFQEYEEFGIREYWVIDPLGESFDVYALDSGGKYQRVAIVDGMVHSTVISGFCIRPEWFASESRPTVREALQAMGSI